MIVYFKHITQITIETHFSKGHTNANDFNVPNTSFNISLM